MAQTITRYVECTKWGVLDIDRRSKRGGSLETPIDSRSGKAQTRRGPPKSRRVCVYGGD